MNVVQHNVILLIRILYKYGCDTVSCLYSWFMYEHTYMYTEDIQHFKLE